MRREITFFLGLCLVFAWAASHAQADTSQKPSTFERIVERTLFGGSFGVQFGNVTLINLSPAIAYKLNERVFLGAGFTYQYINWGQTPFDAHMYGTRVFPIVEFALLYNLLFAQAGAGQGAYNSPIAYRISFFF